MIALLVNSRYNSVTCFTYLTILVAIPFEGVARDSLGPPRHGPAARAACNQVQDTEKFFQAFANKLSLWEQKKLSTASLQRQFNGIWASINEGSKVVTLQIANSNQQLDRVKAGEINERTLTTARHCQISMDDFISSLKTSEGIDFFKSDCLLQIRGIHTAQCKNRTIASCKKEAQICMATTVAEVDLRTNRHIVEMKTEIRYSLEYVQSLKDKLSGLDCSYFRGPAHKVNKHETKAGKIYRQVNRSFEKRREAARNRSRSSFIDVRNYRKEYIDKINGCFVGKEKIKNSCDKAHDDELRKIFKKHFLKEPMMGWTGPYGKEVREISRYYEEEIEKAEDRAYFRYYGDMLKKCNAG